MGGKPCEIGRKIITVAIFKYLGDSFVNVFSPKYFLNFVT